MNTKNQFKRIKYLLALVLIATWSCGDKNQAIQQNEEVGLPPSIQTEETVSTIKISKSDVDNLKIKTSEVSNKLEDYILTVPGVVFPAPGNLSFISTPIEGRISGIKVREGNRVKKGQELFTIESLVFGNLVAEFMQSFAEEKYQKSRVARLEQLVEETISSKSELERARSDCQRATASVIASIAKLKAIGVSSKEIESFKDAGQIEPSLKIYAAIDGIFDQKEVELGQSVNALQKLGRIINLNKVQVKAYLTPDDGTFVSEGDLVTVSRRNEKSELIEGKVYTINPALDETNRSMVANVIISTKSNWPQPGETVRLQIHTGEIQDIMVIPVSALTYDGNQPVVFKKLSDTEFQKCEITIKEIRDDLVLVKSGLNLGDELAVSQVFSLKALSRYDMLAEE